MSRCIGLLLLAIAPLEVQYTSHAVYIGAVSKSQSEEVLGALAFLRVAKNMGQVCLPLSITHYMETLKRREGASRDRLGAFMWNLSSGRTLAWGSAILQYEIANALWHRFPSLVDPAKIGSLDLLGHGMGHARGEPIHRFVVPDEFSSLFTSAGRHEFEGQINDLMERSLLGAGPFAAAAAAAGEVQLPNFSDVEEIFATNLIEVRSWLEKLPPEALDDGVYLMSLTDILKALREALERHNISLSAQDSLNWPDLRALIDDLPTQRVAAHLLREWARNKSLRVKPNDLFDWMSLIPATAYCDVVVTEKLFADLVNRGSLKKQAIVITSLEALPVVLAELSR